MPVAMLPSIEAKLSFQSFQRIASRIPVRIQRNRYEIPRRRTHFPLERWHEVIAIQMHLKSISSARPSCRHLLFNIGDLLQPRSMSGTNSISEMISLHCVPGLMTPGQRTIMWDAKASFPRSSFFAVEWHHSPVGPCSKFGSVVGGV